MLFDGFIVLDSRDNVKHPTPAANPISESAAPKAENSSYDEGKPVYGPFPAPPAAGSTTPAPSTSKVNVGEYITPGTIIAGAGLLSTVGTMFQKSPEQKTLKAICGRKPLLNIGGKKDRYLACVDNYLNPKATVSQNAGMSSGTKVLIGSLVFIFIVLIIVMIVMMNKNKAKA